MKLNEALKWRKQIENAAKHLPDEEAIESVELFPAWEENTAYILDERVRYNHLLYKCITEHTSQSTWTPDAAPSLWARVAEPEEWPEWIQPIGAETAYHIGDKVSHNGKHWISIVDNNVWEPGVYGWDESI